jgi:hypothetical protein
MMGLCECVGGVKKSDGVPVNVLMCLRGRFGLPMLLVSRMEVMVVKGRQSTTFHNGGPAKYVTEYFVT